MADKIINNKYDDRFLKLLDPNLDEAQTAALKVQGNAVIAAGAGSGKTQVLASRFSWLIMTGQSTVDRILTLTFTKKAAAEMYQRIYTTLTFFANQNPSDKITDKNIKLAQDAIKNFSNAHIQTLDSYCGSIVRQCANRYGIRPNFSTDSSDTSRNIKNKAFQFALINKDNSGILKFSEPGKLQDFAENTLARIIETHTSLGTEENYFTKKLSKQTEEIAAAWNYYVSGYIDNSKFANDKSSSLAPVKNYISYIQDTLNVSDKKDEKEKQPYVKSVNDLIEAGFSLSDINKITTEDIVNNTDSLQDSLKAYNQFIDKLKVAINTTPGIKDVKSEVSRLNKDLVSFIDTIIAYINDYSDILSLNKLLDNFLEEINNDKRISGNLSFNDVSSLSLKILLENEDIRNQEKSSYDKIMIDEFQDNNGKNRDLLYLISLKQKEFENNNKYIINISEDNPLINQIIIRNSQGNIIEDKRSPNKLFFVGDEKQSIYKFRGAEVSVFNELTKDKENILIPMNFNYRSKPPLIQAFNTVFQGGNCIFEPFTSEDNKDYEAYYKEKALVNGETLPKLNINNIPIHMNLLNGSTFPKENTDFIPVKDQVAYYMAKKISELADGNEENWDNIAILTKSRTDYSIITKYLSMFNIQYEVDQFNNIFEDGIINDFYNFFRICVYPSDMNSYGAYLASPFCGLSVESVEIVLSHLIHDSKENNTEFNPFTENNIDSLIEQDLSSEDYTKYINGKNYFENKRSVVLQQPITDTLSELWHKKGYKYESLLSTATLLCAEHFDMIFELGRNADSNGKSISWFVDQMAVLKKNYFNCEADIDAKNVSYPLEKKHAVKIMTIHKSKGLQFTNVFIYGCLGIEDRGNRTSVFFDESFGVSLKPENGKQNYFYLKGQELAKAKEAAELRRVIYVAITRAIESVNIIGTWSPERKSSSLFHLLEKAMFKFYQNYNKAEEGKPIFNENAGFDYSEILPITYGELPGKYSHTSSTDELRENAIKKLSEMYKHTKIITHKCIPPFERKTPSSLEKEHLQEDSDTGDKYEQSEDILISPDFTPADFGTLVHSYLEAQANNMAPELYEPNIQLFKNLTDKEIEDNKKTCIEMCHKFKESSLGQALEKAKETNDFYRAEWGFRMMTGKTIFTGSIDLIFSNGNDKGTYTIVDYKSDNVVNPEIYIKQQHCYRTAAAKLLHTDEKNISLYLFYLKHNRIEKLD